MKCLNSGCNNSLSDFDIQRLDVKFSWQRFCIDCRRYKKKIKFINCQECGRFLEFKVGNYNVVKIYCILCGKKRHDLSRKPKVKVLI